MSEQQVTEYSGIETVEPFFLPSFCDVRMVFAVVVIAQLLAFIITLVSPGVMDNAWGNLGLHQRGGIVCLPAAAGTYG